MGCLRTRIRGVGVTGEMLTEGADLMEQRSGSAPHDRQTEVKSTYLAPADQQLFLKQDWPL